MPLLPPIIRVEPNMRAYERIRRTADLLNITPGDLRGPVMTRVGQVHRRQEVGIFRSEGMVGAGGIWPRLSPRYEEYKRAHVGRKPILVWSGAMRQKFTGRSDPDYIQLVEIGTNRVSFLMGARSRIATYHYHGANMIRRSKPRAKGAKPKLFRWVLPRRDMITKSAAQVRACLDAIVAWYRDERIPQVVRAHERAIRAINSTVRSKP